MWEGETGILGSAAKASRKREMEMQIQDPEEVAQIRNVLVKSKHGSFQRNEEGVGNWEL